jgi:hypothetical protein
LRTRHGHYNVLLPSTEELNAFSCSNGSNNLQRSKISPETAGVKGMKRLKDTGEYKQNRLISRAISYTGKEKVGKTEEQRQIRLEQSGGTAREIRKEETEVQRN